MLLVFLRALQQGDSAKSDMSGEVRRDRPTGSHSLPGHCKNLDLRVSDSIKGGIVSGRFKNACITAELKLFRKLIFLRSGP
jgi:hypothetical protein